MRTERGRPFLGRAKPGVVIADGAQSDPSFGLHSTRTHSAPLSDAVWGCFSGCMTGVAARSVPLNARCLLSLTTRSLPLALFGWSANEGQTGKTGWRWVEGNRVREEESLI